MRTIRPACAAIACAIGLVVAVPSVAVADEGNGGTCTAAQRTELRQEMAELRSQILDLRLTPAEIAAKKKAHREAVAALRAEYGLPGATLTDAQRSELKAKVAALIAKERQEAADRRADIDPLKAKLQADRAKLLACRAS